MLVFNPKERKDFRKGLRFKFHSPRRTKKQIPKNVKELML